MDQLLAVHGCASGGREGGSQQRDDAFTTHCQVTARHKSRSQFSCDVAAQARIEFFEEEEALATHISANEPRGFGSRIFSAQAARIGIDGKYVGVCLISGAA